jgi:hypothetical protein
MLPSELQEGDECNFTYMIWMKETVISPSTGKSYYAMIQDFNKSETHSCMGIITWNSPTSRQTPLQNMIIDGAFHQLTYAVFPSPVSKLFVYLEKLSSLIW